MAKLDDRLGEALAHPDEVRMLDLRGSDGDRLTALPAAIGKLKRLEVLVLDHNELESLPAEVGALGKLRELHLAHNRLTNAGVPRALWFLGALEVLNLHGNRLSWVDNLGNYQRSELELYLGGNPLDVASYLAPNGKPMHPMWSHVLHMMPLTRTGKFKLRTLSLDLETIAFPLPGPQLHHEPPFAQVTALRLYGRAPTRAERAALERCFPAAAIEALGPASSGPRLSRAPAPLPPPTLPVAPLSPKKAHPEQLERLQKAKDEAAKKGVSLEEVSLRLAAALESRKPKQGEIGSGSSKIGGLPDVPPGFSWPLGDDGRPMQFVAQYRLQDVAPFDVEGRLPAAGLLSFFVGDFEDGRVFFFDDASRLSPAEPPSTPTFAEIEFDTYPYAVCALTWHGAVSAPEAAEYEEKRITARQTPKKASHQVLGWSGEDTYGMFQDDMVLLLRLGSDDRAGMEWGEVGSLFFVLREEHLARRDFGKVEVFSST